MNTRSFIFRLLLISTGLSIVIKYGGSYTPLQPTTGTALTIVLLPSLILGLILGWQYYR